MKRIVIFIDALGWEIVRAHHFCESLLPCRYCVQTRLGYSAGAVPTILTGQPPEVHGHFSFFVHDPAHSPFKLFKFLPSWIFDAPIFGNHRIRTRLSRFLKKKLGYTGYFQLYAMPFSKLPFMRFTETRDLFAPNGIPGVQNLADFFQKDSRRFVISDWRNPAQQNIDEMIHHIQNNTVDVGFIYTADFDGFLHQNIQKPEKIEAELKRLAHEIQRITDALKATGEPYEFAVISDHGMTPLSEAFDAQKILSALPYHSPKDYVAVLDSTMVRFWFKNDVAKVAIVETMNATGKGKFLSEADCKKFKVNFAGKTYGDIFLLNPGIQCAPSDMGNKALPGMHGYSPEDPDSDAVYLSNIPPAYIPQSIQDFFGIITAPFKEEKA